MRTCFIPCYPISPPTQEYESEGIDWTKIEFTDNQECVDVIEMQPPKVGSGCGCRREPTLMLLNINCT